MDETNTTGSKVFRSWINDRLLMDNITPKSPLSLLIKDCLKVKANKHHRPTAKEVVERLDGV